MRRRRAVTAWRVVLAALLALACVVLGDTASWAASGTDHSGTWSWRELGSIASGWGLQECSAERSAGCSVGTGGGTAPGVASFWLASPVVASTGDNMWVIVRGVCANGSTFGSWVWAASTANTGTNLSYSANQCADQMTGTTTFQVGYMQAHTSPTTANVNGDCVTDPNLNCSTPTITGVIQFRNGSAFPAVTQCGYLGAGSYIGGQLAVRVTGVSAVPAGGWAVYGPDPGNNTPTSSPAFTFGASATVDGQAGTYYAAGALSADSAMTARVVALDSTGGPTCYLSLALSSNAVGSSAPVPVDQTNPSGSDVGGSCSWSWNLLRGLVCLFAPQPSQLTSWSAKVNDIKTHPPVNIMTGGFDLISELVSSSGCAWDSNAGGNCQQATSAGDFSTDDGQHVNFLTAAAQLVQTTTAGGILYDLMKAAIWFGFAWWAWERVSRSFGGKEQ